MVRLYHGTSSNYVASIRRDGLRAPGGRLTLSTSLEESKAYADWAVTNNPGSHPVILEYEIPEDKVDVYLGPADIEEGADAVYYPLLRPISQMFLQRIFTAPAKHQPYVPIPARRPVRVRQYRRSR